MGKFKVGETYTISAQWKKCLTEVEQYAHKDGRMLNVETLWRNGTFKVTVKNEEEIEYLQRSLGKGGEEWDADDYEDVELDSTFDGIAEDFVFFGSHFKEDEQEALEEHFEKESEKDWISRYDFLTERGFEPYGCCYYIQDGIYVEEFETDET